MSNVRETRTSLVYATRNKFINKQLNLLFLRYSQINKSRISILEPRKIWFRREKKNTECIAEFRFYGEGIYELAGPMQLLDEWFRSLDTCIMLVSQALWLSLQIWRFGFFILQDRFTQWWKWFTVGCTICFQDTITILRKGGQIDDVAVNPLPPNGFPIDE